MDVTLPNGVVIQGIPDGTSKEQIKQKAIASGLASEQDFAPAPTTEGLMYRPYGINTGIEMPESVSNFMVGAGKGFTDIGRGVQQLFGMGDEEEIAASRERDKPIMETGAGMAGNITSQILSALGPGSALRGLGAAGQALGFTRAAPAVTAAGNALFNPTTFKGAVGSGAALGAVQPTVGDENRGAGAAAGAFGGALGHGLASGIGRVIKPTRSPLSAEDAALAKTLQDKGVPLDGIDLTDSKPLKVIESVLETIPWTAKKAGERAEAKASAFTRAALRSVGAEADRITPEVLDEASTRLGAEFDRLVLGGGDDIVPQGANIDELLQAPLFADDAFFRELQSIRAEMGMLPEGLQDATVNRLLDELLTGAEALRSGGKPAITAAAYQKTSSELAKKAKGARLTDPAKAANYDRLRAALDDMVERNMGPEKLAQWKDARRKWRNLKIIERAADNTREAVQSGLLKPQDLRAAVKSAGKESVVKGKSELAELARAGMKFANFTPDSGTAQRMMYQNLATGGLLGGGLAAGIDPATLAMGVGGPMALQRGLYSPALKNYISTGLLPEAFDQAGQAIRVGATRLGSTAPTMLGNGNGQ